MATVSALLLLLCAPPPAVRGRVFIVEEGEMNQAAAGGLCSEHHTALATVSSQEDNGVLTRKARTSWIGLRRRQPSDKWSNGDRVTFRLVDNSGTSWCAAMKADGGWESLDCTVNKSFMCYIQNGSRQTLHFQAEAESWFGAQRHCRQNYTDLVSIGDERRNAEVQAARRGTEPFWIGLLRDEWQWEDGGDSAYRNWAPREPLMESCVYQRDGGWYSVPCSNVYNPMCHRSFIHVSNETLSWEEALGYCEGGNRTGLLIIDSRAEQEDLEAELRKRNVSEPVWVGLMQSQMFGYWLWLNREAVLPYSNWDGGAPPGSGVSELCGAVVPHKGFRWADKNCRAKYPAACRLRCRGPAAPPPAGG